MKVIETYNINKKTMRLIIYDLESNGKLVQLDERRRQYFLEKASEISVLADDMKVSICLPFEIREGKTWVSVYAEWCWKSGIPFKTYTSHFDFETGLSIPGEDAKCIEDYKRVILDML
ncbi:MAG: hypothetical protein LBV74_01145 [Tannerella sp.]|jgi:hypothetical protein|nr:hypothetical protein [Tannerella sp.]